jgi:hypothetical protein
VAENAYQAKLIKKLEKLFPGCLILKNDPSYRQGMLDLTILFNDMWASLEVKDSISSPLRPNQRHYVDRLNNMSFAAIVYPQNEAEVLDALQQAFEAPWRACIPQP